MSATVEVLPTSSDDDEIVAPSLQKPTHLGTPQPPEEAETSVVGVDVDECNRLKLRGNELFGQGKIDEALAQYRSAILKAPIKPMPRPKRSATAAAAAELAEEDTPGGDADTARRTNNMHDGANASDATEPAPDSVGEEDEVPDTTDYTLTSQVFCNAGYCLMKLEVYDEAVELLSEAIRHDERYQKAYLRRADSQYHLEKWSSAYGDYENYVKLGGVLDSAARKRQEFAKKKTDEEMQKMLGDLKDLGNRFLGNFGLSTDMFKFDKDPKSGGYSMRFERN